MPASLSPSRADKGPHDRLIGLDILRFFAFLAILIFHSTFALWAPHGLTHVPPQHWSGHGLEVAARTLAFSGFTVLFISFFLYGFRGSGKISRLPLWLLGFTVIWIASLQTWPDWWDIYPFLILSMGVVTIARRLRYPEYIAVGAATFLTIPFWRLEPVLQIPLPLKTALIGVCQSRTDLGDWPILPWIAYPVLALSLGRLSSTHRDRLKRISRREIVGWAVALLAAIPWLGKYYVTTLGEEFGCFVFRQPHSHFWAEHVPLLLLVRLSLLSRVQQNLAAHALPQWFSHRPVNQRFFLVYFLHYPLVHAAAALLNRYGLAFHPHALSATVFSVLLTLEAGPVVFKQALKHNKWGEFIWPRINAR